MTSEELNELIRARFPSKMTERKGKDARDGEPRQGERGSEHREGERLIPGRGRGRG